MRRVFVENKVDVIIGPAYQSCAVPHETCRIATYTVLCNLSCVIPFGKANAVEDAKFVRDVLYTPQYNLEAVEGAPCHVQMIGRPMKDEELMQAALIVEKLLQN
ncbi:hypothetical protein N7523_000798 [Penicillium sp. IBT 18751x]|nr:hypothetical protein N7523_000798 [Penicillium sp. IBT 18751x]